MEKKISVLNLTEELAQASSISTAVADTFIRTFFDVISEGLAQDGIVKIKGWGTFKLSAVKDRESVDVTTGERIVIRGYRKVSFLPDAALKEYINKPFAQFETTELNDDFPLDDESVEGMEEPKEEALDTQEPTHEAIAESSEITSSADVVESSESIEEKAKEVVKEEIIKEETAVAEETIIAKEESVSEEVLAVKQETPVTPAALVEPKKIEKQKQPETQGKKSRKSWKYWLPIILLILLSLCLYLYIALGNGFTKPKNSLFKNGKKEDIKVASIDFKDTPNPSVVVSFPEEKKKPQAQGVEVTDTAPQENEERVELQEEKEDITHQKVIKPAVTQESIVEAKSVESVKEATKAETEKTVVQETKPASQKEDKTVSKQEEIQVPAQRLKDTTDKSLKDITMADTTAFTIQGTLATHTLQEGETIVRLAQKYYGDKRLWPYIVIHNGMQNPNSVVIGKAISIPKLKAN